MLRRRGDRTRGWVCSPRGEGVLPYISYTGRAAIEGMVVRPFALKEGLKLKEFRKIVFKQGLKSTHFDEKMSGTFPENYKRDIDFP